MSEVKTEESQLETHPQPPAYVGPPQSVPPGGAYYQPPPGGMQYPPPGAYQQPPGGYPPPGQYQYPPGQQQQQYQQQPAQIQQPKPATTTTTTIVVNATGNCPKCLAGNIVETFTMAGICCGIWLFPCGIICCLRWRRRFCNRCGAMFE